MTSTDHWQATYGKRISTEVTWYRPHLDTALALFDALDLPRDVSVVDAGAGASTWVDDLLARGYKHIAAVDLSERALHEARDRVTSLYGQNAAEVAWLATNVCDVPLPAGDIDVWHDRAAFHFHVTPADIAAYVTALHRALRPGGHAIVSTFADDGPERCSGLPTARYDGPKLAATLGLELVESHRHVHGTPSGGEQRFITALLRN